MAMLAATLLCACGGGDDDAGGSAAADTTPKRVVALDFPSADDALALGVTPVGMYDVTYVKGGIQAWTKAKLGGATPKLLNTDKGFPFEQIAALRPDVILATNTYPLVDESLDKLRRIAPVVKHVVGPGVDTWQQGMLQVGKALGREAQARELIAAAEAKVARAKADHPEFAGRSLAFFNYVPGDAAYAISTERDVSIKFLKQLGFAGVAPAIARLRAQDGRSKISPERYDLLDADMVIGTSSDDAALRDLWRDPLFAKVPAVEAGRAIGLGIGPATAMAFPSALSVPYAVDTLVPKLAAALDS
jgi:iron complex transport system substrate-binding protein